jgi:hypothetical protein
MAIPTQDELLANWSANADTRLTASPTTYGTTAAVATQYNAVHTAFITARDALIASRAAGTRSESLTAQKSQAKRDLLDFARPLYKQIQANTAVTDADKIELGVRVPDNKPTPRPVPGFAPGMLVMSVNGRLVSVRIFDPAFPDRKRMPDGVANATIMSYVGTTPPASPGDFKYEGGTSKTKFDVLFPDSVAPGTQVWLLAFFSNDREQNGPACNPVGAVINYGGSLPMSA